MNPLVEVSVIFLGAPATRPGSHTMATHSADSSLTLQIQAMQTEIDKLTESNKRYGTEKRNANKEIRTLKQALSDSKDRARELQNGLEKMKQLVRVLSTGTKGNVSHGVLIKFSSFFTNSTSTARLVSYKMYTLLDTSSLQEIPSRYVALSLTRKSISQDTNRRSL